MTRGKKVRETAFYDLLGVSPSATSGEIRRGYRIAALRYHPDRAGNTAEATQAFQRVQKVYEVLYDEKKRAIYDAAGEAGLKDDIVSDADLLAELAKGFAPVTPEDIEAYREKYRNGPDEREDLVEFYNKFEGNVSRVLDYIPYSEIFDLRRLVNIYEDLLAKGHLEKKPGFAAARKKLLKRMKEHAYDEKMKAREEVAKTKGVDSMHGLMATIRARGKIRQESFNDWADSLGNRYQGHPSDEEVIAEEGHADDEDIMDSDGEESSESESDVDLDASSAGEEADEDEMTDDEVEVEGGTEAKNAAMPKTDDAKIENETKDEPDGQPEPSVKAQRSSTKAQKEKDEARLEDPSKMSKEEAAAVAAGSSSNAGRSPPMKGGISKGKRDSHQRRRQRQRKRPWKRDRKRNENQE